MAESTCQRFTVLPGVFAVCRLDAGTVCPDWVRGAFVSVTATADELSIVCEAASVPAAVTAARDWRALKVVGPFAFTSVGVLASFAAPLAQVGICTLAIATYNTDYLLVKADMLEPAIATLRAAGHSRIE